MQNLPSAGIVKQLCYWSIDNLPGLSQQEQDRLRACGINDTRDLLSKTSNPHLQRQLAGQLQLHLKYVQKWSALANLAQIPSIGCQYCGLLLHAGIISLSHLKQTPVHRLHQQILRLHVSTMQRRDLCPSVDLVQRWIKEAGRLDLRQVASSNNRWHDRLS